MYMTTVEIKVPEDMKPYIESYDKKQNLYRDALILYQPIRNHMISNGRAAEILGINKYDLIEIYENLGIPYYDIGREELEDEVLLYDKLKEKMV